MDNQTKTFRYCSQNLFRAVTVLRKKNIKDIIFYLNTADELLFDAYGLYMACIKQH